MKRLIGSTGIVAAVALALSGTMVGSASAHHPPPLPNNSVTGCGQVVTTNLTLTHDVGPCAAGHGLIVRGSNITINLNGFSVIGDGATPFDPLVGDAGILLDNVTGVTVTNLGGAGSTLDSVLSAKGTVHLFNAGVVIKGGSGNTVEKLAVSNNVAFAKDGTAVTAYGDGILVSASSGNTIRTNTVKNNAGYGGIRLSGNSDSNTLSGNLVENNDERDNSVFAKQTSGIRVEFGTSLAVCPNNNTIDNNKTERNGNDGIQLFNCATGNVITNNTSEDNGRTGIFLFPGANNNLVGVTSEGVSAPNTVRENGKETFGDGIHVGGSNNQVKNNIVRGNDDDGISMGFCRQNLPTDALRCFAPATGNVIQNNTVTGSGTVGRPPSGNAIIDGELASHGNGIHAHINTNTNTITGNNVSGSVLFDLRDDNNNCTANSWTSNTETTKNPSCLD